MTIVPVQESLPEDQCIVIWTEKAAETFLLSQFSNSKIKLTTFSELGTRPQNTNCFYAMIMFIRGHTPKLEFLAKQITDSTEVIVLTPIFTSSNDMGKLLARTTKGSDIICSCKVTTRSTNYHSKWILWSKGCYRKKEKCFTKVLDWESLNAEMKQEIQSQMIFYLNRTACSLKSRTVCAHGMSSQSSAVYTPP